MRTKLAAAFSLFTAGLLLFLNIYPIRACQDMVFTVKQSALLSQSAAVSGTLASLETLTEETVAQAMAGLDTAPVTRMLVADRDGRILYDTDRADNAVGRYGLLTELAGALEGRARFTCAYSADVEDEIPVNSLLREFIGGCCFYRETD